ncbi:MAG: N-acetylgalactosamine-6-sulfate sulfatase [Planctomycetaceae bacterium]|nr:N-acetylgalactosamine-6-sulfate sulfatase [Planctomycetaceae bacterium]
MRYSGLCWLFLVTPLLAAGRPNLVVIMADDMGYGDASCYGNTAFRTPQLDRLAAEGLRFTDFHSSGAVCSPTRAGLLTGRYQQRAGIPGVINADPKVNRHHGLFPREVTFADVLREAGYRTAVVGKWHLGYRRKFNPIHHGFDRFRGYVSGNIDYLSHVDRMGIADWWDGDRLVPEPGYSTHLITRHAVGFIKQHADRKGRKPFCLYVAHECPHSPYQGPGDRPVRRVGKGQLPGRARKDIKAAYREMMTEMDRGIGAIVAALKEAGVERNTLVLFFSDNGANRNGSNGGLRGFKGSVWEGGHRVPAVAWWPGTIVAARTTARTAITLDVMPTLLELAGCQPPDGHRLDGVSLVGLLRKSAGTMPEPRQEKDEPRTLFWEFRGRSAVRRGPWKLVVGALPGKKDGLFHLGKDPAESHNLVAEHPGRVAGLRAALNGWRVDVAREATAQEKPRSR